jgi:release factor glutamine methyltransferase
MNPFASAARRVAHMVWSRRVRASFNRPDACRLLGSDLVIVPGVLHPLHFASSQWLAAHLSTLDLRGLRVADVGTGSGLLALVAARAGAKVTAIDINPVAVRCAKANAERNGLGPLVEVIESDVFAEVPPQATFDLVITNPPFFPREHRGAADQAFAAGANGEFFRRLAESVPGRLTTGGALLLVHSSDADFSEARGLLEQSGLHPRVEAERRGIFETLTIVRFRGGPSCHDALASAGLAQNPAVSGR